MNVYNCDMFSVVNVNLDQLKFCVVYINGRRYVCCAECNVVFSQSNEPTLALCNLLVRTVVKLCFDFRGELDFLNCDDICMCVVNKQFELLEFLIPFMLTCNMMRFLSLLLLGLCHSVVSVGRWSSLVCL